LNLSSLLVSSIQTDTEILLPCFERYNQHIFTLQLALKRWKDRKSKLLSAVKHFKAKKQEKLDKESAKQSLPVVNTTSSPKSCSSIFDRWFQQKSSPASSPAQDQSEEEAYPVSPTPLSPEEEAIISSHHGESEELTISSVAIVGNITIDDNPDEPITTSDSEKLLPTPTQPIDLEIAHWSEVVNDLREEYQHLSEQTLNEFHPFMENKKFLVLESIFQYATRQVPFLPLPSLTLCSCSFLITLRLHLQLSTCQQSHQVWEDTMSSLLEDNPSYDLKTLPPLPETSASISQHSRHSFIHKFGLINPTADGGSGVMLSERGKEEDLAIRPIVSFLGGERGDECHPLYVSDSGTIEI
jgi:hypothetical protein